MSKVIMSLKAPTNFIILHQKEINSSISNRIYIDPRTIKEMRASRRPDRVEITLKNGIVVHVIESINKIIEKIEIWLQKQTIGMDHV